MRKLAFISQPMRGFTDEEILATRNAIAKHLENLGYEVVNSFFPDEFKDLVNKEEMKHPPIYTLAKSLSLMSTCDLVYFAKGWENARGCVIEHEVATRYGMEVMYEE